MTFDSSTDTALLQVSDSGITTEQTWEFHGGKWTQLHPPTEPTPRWYAAMAFDPRLNETILYGGLGNLPNSSGSELWLRDTWGYSHGDWSLLANQSGSTTYQYSEGLAFDPLTNQLILVTNSLAPPIGGRIHYESYTFNGTGWSPTPSSVPVDASEAGFSSWTFDPAFGGLVGQAVNLPELFLGNLSTELWVLAAGNWSTVFVQGYPTMMNGMTYDPSIGFGVGFSLEPTLNVSGPAFRGATWILSPVSLGALPTVSIQAVSGQLVLGEAVWIGVAFNGTYGYAWYALGINAPGCVPVSNAEWITCTPSAPGTFRAYFYVLDQAGRYANVSLQFSIQEPIIPPTLVLPLGLVGLAIGVTAVSVLAISWKRRLISRRRGPRFAEHRRDQP